MATFFRKPVEVKAYRYVGPEDYAKLPDQARVCVPSLGQHETWIVIDPVGIELLTDAQFEARYQASTGL